MQSHRYWIGRGFQEAKSDISLAEYQFRGWLVWHHHMAMVMMAQNFILQEKLHNKNEMPLLMAGDIREILIHHLPENNYTREELEYLIKVRQEKRRRDILRHYISSS